MKKFKKRKIVKISKVYLGVVTLIFFLTILLFNIYSRVASDNLIEVSFIKLNEFMESFLSNNINYDLLKDEHINGATKLSLINRWDEVLSLDLTKEKTHGLEEEYIKEMIEKRTEAKKNKDFALADSIREELLKQGIILKDTREGTIYEVK